MMKIKKIFSKPYWKIRHFATKIGNRILTIKDYVKLILHDKGRGYSTKEWSYLVFDHRMGGGATQYLNDKLAHDSEFRQRTIIVRYMDPIKGYAIEFIEDQNRYHYRIPSFKKTRKLLERLDVQIIYVNELFEYENVYIWLSLLKEMKEQKNCELIFLLHDYYCICPVSNLTLKTNQYCKFEYDCNICLEQLLGYERDLYGDICEWRKNWKSFLKQCSQIIAFSNDTRDKIQAVHGDIPIDVIPHEVYNKFEKVQVRKNSEQKLKVGILGTLSAIKGLDIVRNMVNYVQSNKLPIEFVLIGDICGEDIEESSAFCKTGRYKREDLPEIIENHQIDIILVASVCPETFSYTTHEAIMMGLPIMCFDLGAQAEYIKSYERGMVIPEVDCKATVEMLLSYLEEIKNGRA